VFDCGRTRLASVEAFNLKDIDSAVRDLSAPCYMVDHPNGQLLWDAGLPSELAEAECWVVRPDGLSNTLDETLIRLFAANWVRAQTQNGSSR
jgi:hypothetical protein